MIVTVHAEVLSEDDPEVSNRVAAHLTCHSAIFTIVDGELSLLLTERNQGPFRFQWELPGLTPQPEEELGIAARRSCAALLNTNSTVEIHQLGAYGHPDRDPRHRAVAVVYWGVAANINFDAAIGVATSNSRVVAISEFTSDEFRFAFDHRDIASDAVRALRRSLAHTSLATQLCPPTFTISQLQRVYEAVFNTSVSAGNFHRKVRNTPGFIHPAGNSTRESLGKGRPAQLFQASELVELSSPFSFEVSPQS
jgi:8-oxo-dGTP diphosphatase